MENLKEKYHFLSIYYLIELNSRGKKNETNENTYFFLFHLSFSRMILIRNELSVFIKINGK